MFSPANAPSRGNCEQDRVGMVDRLLESIRQQPGIAAAGTITNIPLSGDSGKTAITPKGYVPPPGQSAARSLFLRRQRRLLHGPRHSAARRTLPDLGGFSPPGTRLRGGRGFGPALLAQWRRARPEGLRRRQRIGGSKALHHCRRGRRGKTSGAHGSAGQGAVYLPYA